MKGIISYIFILLVIGVFSPSMGVYGQYSPFHEFSYQKGETKFIGQLKYKISYEDANGKKITTSKLFTKTNPLTLDPDKVDFPVFIDIEKFVVVWAPGDLKSDSKNDFNQVIITRKAIRTPGRNMRIKYPRSTIKIHSISSGRVRIECSYPATRIEGNIFIYLEMQYGVPLKGEGTPTVVKLNRLNIPVLIKEGRKSREPDPMDKSSTNDYALNELVLKEKLDDRSSPSEASAAIEERKYLQALKGSTYDCSSYLSYCKSANCDPKKINTIQKRRSSLLDKSAWDYAMQTNTIQSYKNYYNDYPNGLYSAEARNRFERLIEELRARNEKALYIDDYIQKDMDLIINVQGGNTLTPEIPFTVIIWQNGQLLKKKVQWKKEEKEYGYQALIRNLNVGAYTIRVIDNLNEFSDFNMLITSPDDPVISFEVNQLSINEGQPPFEVLITGRRGNTVAKKQIGKVRSLEINPSDFNLSSGKYKMSVIDIRGVRSETVELPVVGSSGFAYTPILVFFIFITAASLLVYIMRKRNSRKRIRLSSTKNKQKSSVKININRPYESSGSGKVKIHTSNKPPIEIKRIRQKGEDADEPESPQNEEAYEINPMNQNFHIQEIAVPVEQSEEEEKDAQTIFDNLPAPAYQEEVAEAPEETEEEKTGKTWDIHQFGQEDEAENDEEANKSLAEEQELVSEVAQVGSDEGTGPHVLHTPFPIPEQESLKPSDFELSSQDEKPNIPPNMNLRNEFKEFVRNGEVQNACKLLGAYFSEQNDNENENALLLLQAKLSDLVKRSSLGLLSQEDYNLEYSNIMYGILHLGDELP